MYTLSAGCQEDTRRTPFKTVLETFKSRQQYPGSVHLTVQVATAGVAMARSPRALVRAGHAPPRGHDWATTQRSQPMANKKRPDDQADCAKVEVMPAVVHWASRKSPSTVGALASCMARTWSERRHASITPAGLP